MPCDCDGTMGGGCCVVVIIDGVDIGDGTDCGRGFEMPDTASDLDEGQIPRPFLGCCVQPSRSACALKESLRDCGAVLERVDVVEAVETDASDEAEDEELLRGGPLRGRNIRVTSSALMEFKSPSVPLSPGVHPSLGKG